MSIFYDMHQRNSFDSWRDFTEVQRMVKEAIERGFVEEIPVSIVRPLPSSETWYREKATGEIYSLAEPNPPARGSWVPIHIDDFVSGGSTLPIQ